MGRKKQEPPAWIAWLKESRANQEATKEAVRNDPDARATVDGAVGRLSKMAREKSYRAVDEQRKRDTRAARKREPRSQRDRLRREQATITLPVTIDFGPATHEPIGLLTVHASALAYALARKSLKNE